MYENENESENYKNYLKGLKCEHCKKSLRTNKSHINYYRYDWVPKYHKKCHAVALYLQSFYE